MTAAMRRFILVAAVIFGLAFGVKQALAITVITTARSAVLPARAPAPVVRAAPPPVTQKPRAGTPTPLVTPTPVVPAMVLPAVVARPAVAAGTASSPANSKGKRP